MGDAIFACLDSSTQLSKDDDHVLLRSIFHPALTDRRTEGDLFVPPSARHSYVHKLRALVKDEETMRAKRKEAFLSVDFKMEAPGSLFPHSWTASIEVAEGLKFAKDVTLQACPECKHQAILRSVIEETSPVFDEC